MRYLTIAAFIFIILLITVVGYAEDRPWTFTEKSLFASYTVLNVADILQTRYVFESDKYNETNPVLDYVGKNGATAIQVGTNVLLYVLADQFPRIRTPGLIIVTGLKVAIVGNNIRFGLGFAF